MSGFVVEGPAADRLKAQQQQQQPQQGGYAGAAGGGQPQAQGRKVSAGDWNDYELDGDEEAEMAALEAMLQQEHLDEQAFLHDVDLGSPLSPQPQGAPSGGFTFSAPEFVPGQSFGAQEFVPGQPFVPQGQPMYAQPPAHQMPWSQGQYAPPQGQYNATQQPQYQHQPRHQHQGQGHQQQGQGLQQQGQGKGYQQRRRDPESDKKSIYVGNCAYTATDDDLREHFSGTGTITRCTIRRDKRTQKPLGHAFVEFSDEAGAIAAAELNGTQFKGRTLKVSRKR